MKLLALTLSLVSLNAMADVVNFKCEMNDIKYINQFAIEMSVDTADKEFQNVSFDFNLRNAGNESRYERAAVTRDGIITVIPAGDMGKFDITRVVSAVKGDELEFINLLVDAPVPFSSQVRFLNGKTFFGTCKSK